MIRSIQCVWVAALIAVLAWACTDSGGPSSAGLGERDAAEDQVCRLNSDCAPGYYCKNRRCDLDCRTSRDCPVGQSCESGECLGAEADAAPPGCVGDEQCGPPGTICVSGACVSGCTTGGCAEGLACVQGRCVATDCRRDGCGPGETCDPAGACHATAACDPPCAEDEYCDAELGRCVLPPPGCTPGGCPAGERCNANTGACEPAPFDCTVTPCEVGQRCDHDSGQCRAFDCALDGCPDGQRCDPEGCVPDVPRRESLGGPCERAFHCASDMCLSEPNNELQGFCTQTCCSENDCPAGFGCIYYAGVRACFPSRLFPTNNFDVQAGGRCDRVNDCRTGICDGERCLGSCCTNADCLGATCELLPTGGGSARAVCDLGNVLGGFDFSPCGSEWDCMNRLCVADPNAQPNQPPGYCAPLCCSHADCGGALGCGQVLVQDFVISACVPLTRGPAPDGAACFAETECASGHCVENTCSSPCCTDRECGGGGLRCLPRLNGEGTLIRVCVAPDAPPED